MIDRAVYTRRFDFKTNFTWFRSFHSEVFKRFISLSPVMKLYSFFEFGDCQWISLGFNGLSFQVGPHFGDL